MVEPQPRRFLTTHWSLVVAAGSDEADDSSARTALEELCRAYWYPLYAFVRARGYSEDDARDLTQSFFARILESIEEADGVREVSQHALTLVQRDFPDLSRNTFYVALHRCRAQLRGLLDRLEAAHG